MGSNSAQGVATLVFLLAFTCLGTSMYMGGNVVLGVLFVAGLAASIAMFLKIKSEPLPQRR